jgi:hypothetical protein
MPAWLTPTVRSISWWPLATVAACIAATTAAAEYADRSAVDLVGVVAAALAAAVVIGLRDPAAALLSAVPTSLAVRRARRLALLVPVEVAVWMAAVDRSLGGLAALTAAGLAVAVWAPGSAGLAAGVAVPLAWVVAARAGGLAWDLHSQLVTVAALAALWTGRNR